MWKDSSANLDVQLL